MKVWIKGRKFAWFLVSGAVLVPRSNLCGAITWTGWRTLSQSESLTASTEHSSESGIWWFSSMYIVIVSIWEREPERVLFFQKIGNDILIRDEHEWKVLPKYRLSPLLAWILLRTSTQQHHLSQPRSREADPQETVIFSVKTYKKPLKIIAIMTIFFGL